MLLWSSLFEQNEHTSHKCPDLPFRLFYQWRFQCCELCCVKSLYPLPFPIGVKDESVVHAVLLFLPGNATSLFHRKWFWVVFICVYNVTDTHATFTVGNCEVRCSLVARFPRLLQSPSTWTTSFRSHKSSQLKSALRKSWEATECEIEKR